MCDNEGPMAMRTVMRRARKEHRCCECRGVIAIGAVYEFISGIWDHQPSSYRTCGLCADVRSVYVLLLRVRRRMMSRYRRYDDDDCWPPFGLLYDNWEFPTYPAHTGLKRRLPHAA